MDFSRSPSPEFRCLHDSRRYSLFIPVNPIPKFLFGLVSDLPTFGKQGSSEKMLMVAVSEGFTERSPRTRFFRTKGPPARLLERGVPRACAYPSAGSWPVRLCEHARGKDRSPSALCPRAAVKDAIKTQPLSKQGSYDANEATSKVPKA